MTRRHTLRLSGLLLAAVLLNAACRQPEGAMPVPAGEQPNKIDDISHDLQNVAGAAANARTELADDLSSLDPTSRPAVQIVELSEGLGSALEGRPLTDADAKKIAQLLFVLITARELNQTQIEGVAAQLRQAIVSVGAQPAAADRVSATASTLANGVTRNKKRWYHR